MKRWLTAVSLVVTLALAAGGYAYIIRVGNYCVKVVRCPNGGLITTSCDVETGIGCGAGGGGGGAG